MIEVNCYDTDILKKYGFYPTEIDTRHICKLTDHISLYIHALPDYNINSHIGFCTSKIDGYHMREVLDALDKSMIIISELTRDGIIEVIK